MKLSEAEVVAGRAIKALTPLCVRIKAVGSIRRGCEEVNDIDLLLIPKGGGVNEVNGAIKEYADSMIQSGSKVTSFMKLGMRHDVYFATLDNWPYLLLVKTGSKGSNIRLARRAKALGMTLSMGGALLGSKVKARDERDIFSILGLPYVKPEDR